MLVGGCFTIYVLVSPAAVYVHLMLMSLPLLIDPVAMLQLKVALPDGRDLLTLQLKVALQDGRDLLILQLKLALPDGRDLLMLQLKVALPDGRDLLTA